MSLRAHMHRTPGNNLPFLRSKSNFDIAIEVGWRGVRDLLFGRRTCVLRLWFNGCPIVVGWRARTFLFFFVLFSCRTSNRQYVFVYVSLLCRFNQMWIYLFGLATSEFMPLLEKIKPITREIALIEALNKLLDILDLKIQQNYWS